ncbi:MAG: hypothetical protein EA384_08975 [Spirochaetaceae bacterium]|nr:MAG: hypothetical protein EA384_08975 [Spirochaetaceae bacterium]
MDEKTTIEVQLPERLADGIQSLIEDGWYHDTNAVVTEALRRFVDSHATRGKRRPGDDDPDSGLRGIA